MQRLPDGPPDLSRGRDGRDGTVARRAPEGVATAAYLRRLGIDVDLAPVLDTPDSPDELPRHPRVQPRPAAERGARARRSSQGLQRGGVAATAKHFPGLGTARASTDTNRVLLTTPRARARRAAWRRSRRAIDAGVEARHGQQRRLPRLRPDAASRPSSRGRSSPACSADSSASRGVVISDAMEAPGPERPAGRRRVARSPPASTSCSTRARRRAPRATPTLVAAARSGTLPLSDLRGRRRGSRRSSAGSPTTEIRIRDRTAIPERHRVRRDRMRHLPRPRIQEGALR